MKSQLFIRESVKAHHHSRPEHLVCAHPLGSGIAFFSLSFVEILKNIVTNGRSVINQQTDDFQLSILRVTGSGFNQRHLFLLFLAHFVMGLFLFCVVILGVWGNTLYYIQ